MPIHDLVCPTCGASQSDVYCPLITLPEPVMTHGFLTTQVVRFPTCPCGQIMTFLPPRVAMDLTFQKFSTQLRQPDGSYREVEIDSVAKMRAIERTTEQAARNGEGEAIRFRMWSQNSSSGDVNSFGSAPAPALDPAAKRRFGLRGGALKSVEAPDVALGPGVSEANVSALADQ